MPKSTLAAGLKSAAEGKTQAIVEKIPKEKTEKPY